MTKKRKLLIADSHTDEREMLIQVFSNLEEIELLPAAEGYEQTLAALHAEPKPDILLLDLLIRGGDAIGVLDEIETLPKSERPLVFLMSAISDEHLLMALQDKIVFCFLKPMKPERVLLRVLQLGCAPDMIKLIIRKDDPLLVPISEMLLSLGPFAHLAGYRYLRDAIRLYASVDNPLKLRLTRDVYPLIAKEYRTTVSVVENAIRFLIDDIWTIGNPKMLHQMFGYTVNEKCGKPGCMEFIVMLAEQVRIRCGL